MAATIETVSTKQEQSKKNDSSDRQLIEERAYCIWQGEDKPNGRALDHWLQAEHEITSAMPSIHSDNPVRSNDERKPVVRLKRSGNE